MEPTDEECEWQSDHEDEAALAVIIIRPLTLKSDLMLIEEQYSKANLSFSGRSEE